MKRLLIFGLVLPQLLLSGCLWLPAWEQVTAGKRITDDIGSADSHRPIRTGVSMRQEVSAQFGDPVRTSNDGNQIAYVWSVNGGRRLWLMPPMIGGVDRLRGYHAAVLSFDQNNRLHDYYVVKNDETIFDLFQLYPQVTLPNDFSKPQIDMVILEPGVAEILKKSATSPSVMK